MFQIVESFVTTLTSLVEAHGIKVVIAVLAVVGSGIVSNILYRVLSGRGSGQL